MDQISRLVNRNYTLAMCNRVYPNAFQLGNGYWVLYAKQFKLIPKPKKVRATGKKYATSSSCGLGDESFFTYKPLRGS